MGLKLLGRLLAAAAVTIVLVFVLIVCMLLANAHEAGVDPEADWFNSLRANDIAQTSCCGAHKDCQPVTWRASAQGVGASYDILWQGEWVHVPPDAVLPRYDNPTGSAVACVGYVDGHPFVRCFVRAAEG